MINEPVDGIHIVGNLYMQYESLDKGKVGYSMYSIDKKGARQYFKKSNAGPSFYVIDKYFDGVDLSIDKGGKSSKGGGKKKK